MHKTKIDNKKVENIIKNTIDTVNENKAEVFNIAQIARKQCKLIETEYEDTKRKIENVGNEIKFTKVSLDSCKKYLKPMPGFYRNYSQKEIENAQKKEFEWVERLNEKTQEQISLNERRAELEVSLKESYETVKKAEAILENIRLSLAYLSGNLLDISSQMEGLTQKYHEGLKIICAQEEERQKVARDIYNGPIKLINSAEIETIKCQNVINTDKAEAKRCMKALKIHVRESVADIRKIIYNLRPMSLEDLGLATTLRRYIENFEAENQINVTINTIGLERDITAIISLTAFRIVQEALENIKKHSSAKDAKVLIERKGERLELRISDEGKGFDVEKLQEQAYYVKGGIGLFSINERVGLLNGKMEIFSNAIKGTTIAVSIPLIFSDITT